MSGFYNISVEKQAGLAYLTIDRPKALNALNKQPWRKLVRRWRISATMPEFPG